MKKFSEFKPKAPVAPKDDAPTFTGKKEPLSTDIERLHAQLGKLVKLKDGEFTLVQVVDVSTTDPTAANTELKEAATIISADFSNKEVKRNDELYITAMVNKNGVAWNSMAVFKVRVVDIFQGLSALNGLR